MAWAETDDDDDDDDKSAERPTSDGSRHPRALLRLVLYPYGKNGLTVDSTSSAFSTDSASNAGFLYSRPEWKSMCHQAFSPGWSNVGGPRHCHRYPPNPRFERLNSFSRDGSCCCCCCCFCLLVLLVLLVLLLAVLLLAVLLSGSAEVSGVGSSTAMAVAVAVVVVAVAVVVVNCRRRRAAIARSASNTSCAAAQVVSTGNKAAYIRQHQPTTPTDRTTHPANESTNAINQRNQPNGEFHAEEVPHHSSKPLDHSLTCDCLLYTSPSPRDRG